MTGARLSTARSMDAVQIELNELPAIVAMTSKAKAPCNEA